MKCQGENGFARAVCALTSASGILLKPDEAWPERGTGSRPAALGEGSAGRRLGLAGGGAGPPRDFGAGECAANLLQGERTGPPGVPVLSDPLPERVGPWQG